MVINWAHPSEIITAGSVAVIVLGAVYALFRVMFAGASSAKPEPLIPLPDKRYRRILVPTGVGMCSNDYVSEAASLACKLAAKKGSNPTEVVFTYVIPVPRALPVTADMPEEEAEAQRILDAASGLARKQGLTCVTTQLRKGRTVIDETLKAVDQENIDLVILTPQTHEAAEAPMPMTITQQQTIVPATQAAMQVQAVHAGGAVGTTSASCTLGRGKSCCYAELDTQTTSDKSETVTGKLLRRIPCEAIVARRAASATAVASTPRPVALAA